MINLDNFFTYISEKGLTAKNVSDATGISNGNISDWKNGKCMPSAIKISEIADYLNCSVDYLLGRTNKVNSLFPDNVVENDKQENSETKTNNISDITEQQIINLVKTFDEEYKNKVLDFLIDLSIEYSNEQIKKAQENKAYIAALGGGVFEIDPTSVDYLIENAQTNEPKNPRKL